MVNSTAHLVQTQCYLTDVFIFHLVMSDLPLVLSSAPNNQTITDHPKQPKTLFLNRLFCARKFFSLSLIVSCSPNNGARVERGWSAD